MHRAAREEARNLRHALGVDRALQRLDAMYEKAPSPAARERVHLMRYYIQEMAGMPFATGHPAHRAALGLWRRAADRVRAGVSTLWSKTGQPQFEAVWGPPPEAASGSGYVTVGLTDRQLECLRWVALGKSSADIGCILGISKRTVDEHIANACDALGVRRRSQAIVIIEKAGLTNDDP